MIPFHKIYSAVFKSFNITSETDTLASLKRDGVKQVMIIKRSWIFGLALAWVPVLIIFISACNLYISYFSYPDNTLRYSLLIGVSFSLVFFVFSVWGYLSHFREVYDVPKISAETDELIDKLHEGDTYFARFFDQTILNQLILIGLTIACIYFYFSYTNYTWSYWLLLDAGLFCLQWFLLKYYRKRMVDLEMDYNIVIPGKIMFVNQSGMLSSSQTVEGEKVKTITANYPSWIASFFHYGNIEIMTEGGDEVHGTSMMYYVPSPNDTARLIQMLMRGEIGLSKVDVKEDETIKKGSPISVGPDEVKYDVKETVRDVLR